MIEVSDTVIDQGFDRQRANELLGRLAKRLEGEQPAEGFDIAECYDLIHHKPTPEYAKAYVAVKKELAAMGLTMT
jgi:hypothetical protein